MNSPKHDHVDQSARHVLAVAADEASSRHDNAIGTEHLLVALATADTVTARLLAAAGAHPQALRGVSALLRPGPNRPPDHQTLLATLGIDLAEVRQRTAQTFGVDAVASAAARARPRRPRRRLRTWISCSKPLPTLSSESPLAGRRPHPIPRVQRLIRRAARAARPQPATPIHLLLALLEGNEPGCELLEALHVNLDALATAARRSLAEPGAAGAHAR